MREVVKNIGGGLQSSVIEEIKEYGLPSTRQTNIHCGPNYIPTEPGLIAFPIVQDDILKIKVRYSPLPFLPYWKKVAQQAFILKHKDQSLERFWYPL